MSKTDRRKILGAGLALVALPGAMFHLGCSPKSENKSESGNSPSDEMKSDTNEGTTKMQVQYLEIVTGDVDAACQLYSAMHGVTFAEPDQDLGGARTAKMANGGVLGIRAPLRDTETPVVRPYMLVTDINAAVAAAEKAGADIAFPPTKLGNHGTCAIVVHGGIESGLWQT